MEVCLLELGVVSECVGYIVKYVTKLIEVVGGLMHLLFESDVVTLRIRLYVCWLVEMVWWLGSYLYLCELRLCKWVYAFGFCGHCFMKSCCYLIMFTKLR